MLDTEFPREGMKMGKTIKCTLSQKSIRNAINELKAYQKDLQRKNELFVKRLCEEGLQVIQTTMESIPDEEKGSYYTEIIYNKNGDITGASVRLSGDKVLFIEFSAGITYGSNNYPLPSGSEYGVGTYPGQTHAFSPYGWWYTDERSGETRHSYGNRAYMPMYHAEQAVIIAVCKIAKEVFSS